MIRRRSNIGGDRQHRRRSVGHRQRQRALVFIESVVVDPVTEGFAEIQRPDRSIRDRQRRNGTEIGRAVGETIFAYRLNCINGNGVVRNALNERQIVDQRRIAGRDGRNVEVDYAALISRNHRSGGKRQRSRDLAAGNMERALTVDGNIIGHGTIHDNETAGL